MTALDDERAAHQVCVEMRDAAYREIKRLRRGIQNYLDGDYDPRVKKIDRCPHGRYGYETCEDCTDAHFAALLAESDEQSDSPG